MNNTPENADNKYSNTAQIIKRSRADGEKGQEEDIFCIADLINGIGDYRDMFNGTHNKASACRGKGTAGAY